MYGNSWPTLQIECSQIHMARFKNCWLIFKKVKHDDKNRDNRFGPTVCGVQPQDNTPHSDRKSKTLEIGVNKHGRRGRSNGNSLQTISNRENTNYKKTSQMSTRLSGASSQQFCLLYFLSRHFLIGYMFHLKGCVFVCPLGYRAETIQHIGYPQYF